MAKFYCIEEFKNCPYRFFKLNEDRPLCDYYRLHAKLMVAREFSKIPDLYNKACNRIREDELRIESLAKISEQYTQEMLKKVEVGDQLFWTRDSEVVELLEKPAKSPTDINHIIRFKCRRKNGIIVSIPANRLRYIYKGSFSGDCFINSIKSEEEARQAEREAQFYGFRTELKRQKNGYLLTLFGDSQEDVDDFINLALRNKLELLRLLAGPPT